MARVTTEGDGSIRESLAARAARKIGEWLADGRWQQELPAERILAGELGISRSTLRDALDILTQEGRIEPAQRPARRLIPRKPRAATRRLRRIILLSPYRLDQRPGSALQLEDDLRRLMEGSGYQLALRTSTAFNQARPDAALKGLTATEPSAIWLLLQAPRTVHAWFHQTRLPCAVIGECYEGLPLPHVTEDVHAMAWHAAGLLRQRGHTRVALLHRQPPRAGHLAAAATFRREGGLELTLAGYGPEREAVVQTLSGLFDNQPPTALMVTEPACAITAMTFLGRKGLRAPEDVTILSLFPDSSLGATVPDIAHYRTPPDALPRRLMEIVDSLSRGKRVQQRPPLMPVFVNGGSLGRCHR